MHIADRLAQALRGLLNQAVVDTADPEDINPQAVRRAQQALETYDRDPLPCVLPYLVEGIYRVHLQLDAKTTVEQEEAFFTRVFKIQEANLYQNLDVTETSGGPAHAPYVTVIGGNKATVIAYCDRLVKAARVLKITLER